MDFKFISEIRLKKTIPEHSYLRNIPAVKYFQNGNIFKFNKDLTIFVGENGTGKSTLIEAIAVASKFNPEGGTLSSRFSTHDTHSDLHEYFTITRQETALRGYFFRAESFYNHLSYNADIFADLILIGEFEDLHRKSHGESFLGQIKYFGSKGLYIFDEPESALSPSNILVFMCELDRLLKNNSQVIIATHSPIIMAFPGAEVYQLDENGIESVDYKETSHFRITKDFLECPERMLKHLLGK